MYGVGILWLEGPQTKGRQTERMGSVASYGTQPLLRAIANRNDFFLLMLSQQRWHLFGKRLDKMPVQVRPSAPRRAYENVPDRTWAPSGTVEARGCAC